jgi:hypothetical protein
MYSSSLFSAGTFNLLKLPLNFAFKFNVRHYNEEVGLYLAAAKGSTKHEQLVGIFMVGRYQSPKNP